MLQESHRGTRPPPTRLLLLRQKHLVPISSRFKATPAEPQFPWAAATEPELGLCTQPHPQALGLSFLHGVGRKSSPQDACSEKGYTVRPHARSRGPGRPPSPDRLPPASPSSGVSLGLFLSLHATPPCDSRGLGCAPTQSHVYKHPTPPGPAWRYVLARFSLGNGTAQSRGEPSSKPGLQGAVLPSLLIAVSPGEAAGQGGRGTWTWKLGAEWAGGQEMSQPGACTSVSGPGSGCPNPRLQDAHWAQRMAFMSLRCLESVLRPVLVSHAAGGLGLLGSQISERKGASLEGPRAVTRTRSSPGPRELFLLRSSAPLLPAQAKDTDSLREGDHPTGPRIASPPAIRLSAPPRPAPPRIWVTGPAPHTRQLPSLLYRPGLCPLDTLSLRGF